MSPPIGQLRVTRGMRFLFFALLFATSVTAQPVRFTTSTYFGGNSADAINSMARDANGNIWVTGYTYSSDFPVTPNALQPKHAGVPGTLFGLIGPNALSDAFVAKFDPSGARLYASYLGGESSDLAVAIVLDSAGNPIVAGNTSSASYPATASFTVGSGLAHGFVTKFLADGSAMQFSVVFGGSSTNVGAIALDAAGDIYVAGKAGSADFTGSTGAFVVKLNGDGTGIVWKMAVAPMEIPSAIAVAQDGRLALAGTAAGKAVLAWLDPSGNLISSTAFGLSGSITPAGRIWIDDDGGIVFCGSTRTKDFLSPGAATQNDSDAFVAKWRADGTGFAFTALLGGSRDDAATNLSRDSSGSYWVSGFTYSTDFPTQSPAPFAASPALFRGATPFGNPPFVGITSDAFVARFASDGSRLLAIEFGGSGGDVAEDLLATANGVWLAGLSTSNDFPVILPAVQPKRSRASCTTSSSPSSSDTQPCVDAFLARLQPVIDPPPLAITVRNYYSQASTPIAPGGLYSILGSRIGPASDLQGQFDSSGNLTTQLGNTRVLIDGVPVPILGAHPGRIDIVAPASVASKGAVTLEVETDGAAGPSVSAVTGEASPAIAVTQGVAGVLNADGTLNSPSNPAVPGDGVAVFVIGFGGPGPDGSVAGGTTALPYNPFVVVGNRVADISYAGTTPSLLSAVTQINFRVPDYLFPAQTGDFPLWVMGQGFTSQTGVTISIRF